MPEGQGLYLLKLVPRILIHTGCSSSSYILVRISTYRNSVERTGWGGGGRVTVPTVTSPYCHTLSATQTSWSCCSYPHLCPPSRSTCDTPVSPISPHPHGQAKPRFSIHVPFVYILFLPPRILFPVFSTQQTYSSQTSAQYLVFLGNFFPLSPSILQSYDISFIVCM